MTKPTREQLPFYNRFMRLVENPEFVQDVERLRTSKKDILHAVRKANGIVKIPSAFHQFMTKHGFPISMEQFVYFYVSRNEINLEKLQSGVYIVDFKNKEASGLSDNKRLNYFRHVNDSMRDDYIHVVLAVPVHATTTQINDTIKQHKQFIKDRQAAANNNTPVPRIRSEYYAMRDKEIMRLYDKGLPPRKIVHKLPEEWRGLSTVAISNIIYRRKKQR